MSTSRPAMFVISTSGSLGLAKALQFALRDDYELVIWDETLMKPGRSYLESLLEIVTNFDYAVAVLGGDDLTIQQGVSNPASRDNVFFELGLFMSRLGRERTFIVTDKERAARIPSDLAAIHTVRYLQSGSGNLQSALGTAATEIREALKHASHPRVQAGLNDVQRIVANAGADVKKAIVENGETGPEEQAYFDKFAQIRSTTNPKSLTLLYVDIDGLRAATRVLFANERSLRPRRPEFEIRAEFLRLLNIAIGDAVYTHIPSGIKHDVFTLPDPDAVLIARKLRYDDGLKVAGYLQEAFREVARDLWPKAASAPSVSVLVCNYGELVEHGAVPGIAATHRQLRKRLKDLKDAVGRGQVFGQDRLSRAHHRVLVESV